MKCKGENSKDRLKKYKWKNIHHTRNKPLKLKDKNKGRCILTPNYI